MCSLSLATAAGHDGKYADALRVLDAGLILAPSHDAFQNNRKVMWQEWALAGMEKEKDETVLNVVQQAVPDGLGYLAQRWAKKAYDKGGERRAKVVLAQLV